LNPKFKNLIPKTKKYTILIIFIHLQKFENPQNRLNLHHYQIFFHRTGAWLYRRAKRSGSEKLWQPSANCLERCQYPAGNGIIIWTQSWKNNCTNYF